MAFRGITGTTAARAAPAVGPAAAVERRGPASTGCRRRGGRLDRQGGSTPRAAAVDGTAAAAARPVPRCSRPLARPAHDHGRRGSTSRAPPAARARAPRAARARAPPAETTGVAGSTSTGVAGSTSTGAAGSASTVRRRQQSTGVAGSTGYDSGGGGCNAGRVARASAASRCCWPSRSSRLVDRGEASVAHVRRATCKRAWARLQAAPARWFAGAAGSRELKMRRK